MEPPEDVPSPGPPGYSLTTDTMDRSQYMKAYRAQYKERMKVIKVALDPTLYRGLQRLAKRQKAKMTTLIRTILANATTDQALATPSVESDLKTLVRLMRNAANNLNQMAHHSNVVRRVVDESAVFAELRRLEKHVNDYTNGRLRGGGDP